MYLYYKELLKIRTNEIINLLKNVKHVFSDNMCSDKRCLQEEPWRLWI